MSSISPDRSESKGRGASCLFDTVLLVEDEDAHAMLVSRALAGLSQKVTRCASLQAAEQMLREGPVDLIITDWNLPDTGLGGPVGRLKASGHEAPVIVLTSSSAVEDGVTAMKQGASDFVVKQFDSGFRDVLQLTLARVFAASAVEKEKAELRRKADILRLAIESTPDGLALLRSDGSYWYLNAAFERFLQTCGAPANTIFDMCTEQLLYRQALHESLEQVLAARASSSSEVALAGQRDVAFELSVLPLDYGVDTPQAPSGGDHADFVVWTRDARERKRRERHSRQLLSTTTHDLKGPLGSIALSCELLSSILGDTDVPLPPNVAVKLERIKTVVNGMALSSQGALQLIEELLSARRIEEGSFVMKPAPTDVAEVVREVIRGVELAAAKKQIAIVSELQFDRSEANVDRLGLERVLTNLLSNAMKFTPLGGRVTITAARHGGDLSIRVSDTGCGLEPSEVKTLFQRFGRLTKHAGVAGSGLGLFIVKSIVSAHGGTVEVRSSAGKGTTFELMFPEFPPVDDRGELLCVEAD